MLMNMRVRGITVFRTIYFVPSLIVASVVGVGAVAADFNKTTA